MNNRVFVADFETTVYNGQDHTEVWAAALVELNTDEVFVFNSIDLFFDFLYSIKTNLIVYFHNLKFDGSFILSYLLVKKKYKQAFINGSETEFRENKYMLSKSVKYLISDKGQYYSITVKKGTQFVEFRDSLKLIPLSVKKAGEAFNTLHRKSTIEYEGVRRAGQEIPENEIEYIKNDVLVIKEALEFCFTEGHNRLTIGACCLAEFKKRFDKKEYDYLFPNLYKVDLPENFPSLPGVKTVGDWIIKSYYGGWCYAVPGKCNKILHNGFTVDCNSLYPSVMVSDSGNYYPVGMPSFWVGNYIPDDIKKGNRYYFVHIKTRFYIKKGMLPFIHIRRHLLYDGKENLTTSDYFDRKQNKYFDKYYLDGELRDTRVDLVLTMTDYQRIREFYELKDFEIISGVYFYSEKGLFDLYLNKYRKIKETSTGGKRTIAKLYSNNLYGKMAATTNSSYKVAYIDDGIVKFKPVFANDKKPGYIPIGSAITSYARDFTIRAAQANYFGENNPGFCYADTDSLHCDSDEPIGLNIHPTNYCAWKVESRWETGYFVRQKTYIEKITDNGEERYNMVVAGMPERCKNNFILSMTTNKPDEKIKDYTPEEIAFIETKRDITDFDKNLVVPGCLKAKIIRGGTILNRDVYTVK